MPSRTAEGIGVSDAPPGTVFHPFGGLSAIDDDGNATSLRSSAFEFSVVSECARSIADLCTIESDLHLALDWAQAYNEMDGDSPVRGALFEAALIAYGRCFTTGKSAQGKAQRRQIGDLAEELPAELLTAHRELYALRNQHVGHRVHHTASFLVAGFDSGGRFEDLSRISWTMSSHTGHMESMVEVCRAILQIVGETLHAETEEMRASLAGATITDAAVPRHDPSTGTWVRVALESASLDADTDPATGAETAARLPTRTARGGNDARPDAEVS